MKMTPLPFMKLTNETALNARVGEVRKVEVHNLSQGIHPFHMHGFPFQWIKTTLKEKGKPDVVITRSQFDSELKDTFAVPGRTGNRMESKAISEFLVSFKDDARSGEGLVAHGGPKAPQQDGVSRGWLVHCHILEHAARGMITWLNLWPSDEPTLPGEKHSHHHDHQH